MCYHSTLCGALVVGGGYYVLDRLADPTELVTLVQDGGEVVLVRGARGVEYPVAHTQLSPVPPDEFYRALRQSVEGD